MKYTVPMQFVFEGEFYIETENQEQANEYALKHCGLIMGGDIHSTLTDEDVNWDFSVHPEKVLI